MNRATAPHPPHVMRRGMVLRAIREATTRGIAIVMTHMQTETLALISREMSNPAEGAWRASIFWHDGPLCHITRARLSDLATALADDYFPSTVREIDDAAVMAWCSTPEFRRGVEMVAEVQTWNSGIR